MLRKVFIWFLFDFLGVALGCELVYLALKYSEIFSFLGFYSTGTQSIILILLGGLIGGVVFYSLAYWLFNLGQRPTSKIEKMLQGISNK